MAVIAPRKTYEVRVCDVAGDVHYLHLPESEMVSLQEELLAHIRNATELPQLEPHGGSFTDLFFALKDDRFSDAVGIATYLAQLCQNDAEIFVEEALSALNGLATTKLPSMQQAFAADSIKLSKCDNLLSALINYNNFWKKR